MSYEKVEDWVDRLRRHMDAKGLTQQALADRLDLTYPGVNHWFTRVREPDSRQQFERIALAAECSAAWMLFGIGPEEPITTEDLRLAKVISKLPPGAKRAAEILLHEIAQSSSDDTPHTGTGG